MDVKGFETRSIMVGQDFNNWGHLEMVCEFICFRDKRFVMK